MVADLPEQLPTSCWGLFMVFIHKRAGWQAFVVCSDAFAFTSEDCLGTSTTDFKCVIHQAPLHIIGSNLIPVFVVLGSGSCTWQTTQKCDATFLKDQRQWNIAQIWSFQTWKPDALMTSVLWESHHPFTFSLQFLWLIWKCLRMGIDFLRHLAINVAWQRTSKKFVLCLCLYCVIETFIVINSIHSIKFMASTLT